MATTAIPTVKLALEAALADAPGLEEVDVRRGKEPPGKEYVWIWRGKSNREFGPMGQKPAPLDEEVKVTLRIVAIMGDDVESEDRAYEIFNAVEERLRADHDLGDGVLFQKIGSVEDGAVLFDKKWGFHILLTVTAKARI